MHKILNIGFFVFVLLNASKLNAEKVVDLCTKLEGEKFHSIDKYETGLGPDGLEHGTWSIVFKGGIFEWYYSDLRSRGSYRCDGGQLLAKEHPNRTIKGMFDGKNLIWDGIRYKNNN